MLIERRPSSSMVNYRRTMKWAPTDTIRSKIYVCPEYACICTNLNINGKNNNVTKEK